MKSLEGAWGKEDNGSERSLCGGEVPGHLSLQTEEWAGPWLLAQGLHEPWPLAPRLAAWCGAGPCFPPPHFPLQGTSRPKGKHCQTIGHPGKPPGTGLCVPDKGADTNTAVVDSLCSVLSAWEVLALPSPPEALLLGKETSMSNGGTQCRPLVGTPPPHSSSREASEMDGAGEGQGVRARVQTSGLDF